MSATGVRVSLFVGVSLDGFIAREDFSRSRGANMSTLVEPA